MTVTIRQVESSHPEALTQGGAQMGAAVAVYQAQVEQQRANLAMLKSGWQGAASDAAVADGQRTLTQMQAVLDAMIRVQSAMDAGGAQLTQLRTSVLQAVVQLEGEGWQVAPDAQAEGAAQDEQARDSFIIIPDISGYTDYGRVWLEFLEEISADLDPRSTVIVLGDARTNGRDPHAAAFAKLTERAGRTFWLNPEPRLYWNYGDSVMAAYEPLTTESFECWTTKHLEHFVDVVAKP